MLSRAAEAQARGRAGFVFPCLSFIEEDLMGQNGGSAARSSRGIALVGPYLSGKTPLLQAILARTGAVTRQGKIADKNSVGDATPEAREHGMSAELNVAHVGVLDDTF